MYTRTPSDHSTMLAGEVDGIQFLITKSNMDTCKSRVPRIIIYNTFGQRGVYILFSGLPRLFESTGLMVVREYRGKRWAGGPADVPRSGTT
jgi:hypothetical protein